MKRFVAIAILAGLVATPAVAQTGAPSTITTPMQNKAVGSATTSQSTPRLNTDKDPNKADEAKDKDKDKDKAATQPKPAEGGKAPAETR